MRTLEQTGLDVLRAPFLPNQISKLPKPTKKQTEDVKADYKKGVRCQICNTWHHPDVVHLDYVGHAALTDRLLDADPSWGWEPIAFDAQGYPAIDKDGGMWIKLTVCGVTRLGYGDAQGKSGGDAMKERIGDALRNAAMRFGAALDLWHKGDLHVDEDSPGDKQEKKEKPAAQAAKSPTGKPADTGTGQTTPSTKEPATEEQRAKIHELCIAIAERDNASMDDVLRTLSQFEGTNGPIFLTQQSLAAKCTKGWAGKVIALGEKMLADDSEPF